MAENPAVQQIIAALPETMPTDRRYVVAIAGPPAAGKSTLAEALCKALSPMAAVLELDAFHYDNAILDERGQLVRKGAPHTFDVDGYRRTLQHLRTAHDQPVAIPQFDRDLELTRASAAMVLPSHSLVITEGNYLLLDEAPWSALSPLFDLTVFARSSLELVSARIIERWRTYGFDDTTARERLAANDLPNANLTLERSVLADITA